MHDASGYQQDESTDPIANSTRSGAYDPLSQPLVADGVDTSEHVPFFVRKSCRIQDLQNFNVAKGISR